MGKVKTLTLAIAAYLVAFNQYIVAGQSPCKEYYSKGLRAPTIESISDTITVEDGFPLGNVAVTLDVSHRRVGALVVSLTAQPPAWAASTVSTRRVVLKERGLGRLGDNMYMTTFNDDAAESFPIPADAAPFRGAFRPTQRLSFMKDGAGINTFVAGTGGSQGEWVLRIDDIAPNATIRPIALNGWILRLCPMAQQTAVPTPPPPPTPTPSPVLAPVPTPSPVPTYTPIPPVGSFQGPTSGSQVSSPPSPPPPSRSLFGGWTIMNSNSMNQQQQASSNTGVTSPPPPPQQPAGNTGSIPPVNVPMQRPGLFGLGADPFGIKAFQNNFNAFLLSRYGSACGDPECSNIKLKFWKATIGIAYMKARLSGRIDSSEIMDKLADILPGENRLLGKLSDRAASWEAKRAEILRSMSGWYDQVLKFMAGNTAGIEALLSGAMGGSGGLKALGLDANAAASALGPLLGLDNADDAKALMDGLHQSGFEDLLSEFLDPSSFMF